MKKILFLVLLQTSLFSYACAISPFYLITEDPEKYANANNTIFFGKLVDLEAHTSDFETATFSVLERLKGEVADKVRVTNIIENNCSQHFGKVGTEYYVFGNVNPSGDLIELTGFPSFVTKKYADERGLLDKLKTSVKGVAALKSE